MGNGSDDFQTRLELYCQFLEEARYRDRLLVEEFSIGIVALALLLGVAYQFRSLWPINLIILIIGLFALSLLTYSSSMLSAHRDACWHGAEELEKSLRGGIKEKFIRQKLEETWIKGSEERKRYEKRYPFLRLPESVGLFINYFMVFACIFWLGINLYWIIFHN